MVSGLLYLLRLVRVWLGRGGSAYTPKFSLLCVLVFCDQCTKYHTAFMTICYLRRVKPDTCILLADCYLARGLSACTHANRP